MYYMEDQMLEDLFLRSCHEALKYPRNLVFPRSPDQLLRSYLRDLNDDAARIFCIDSKTEIEFLELDERREGELNLWLLPGWISSVTLVRFHQFESLDLQGA